MDSEDRFKKKMAFQEGVMKAFPHKLFEVYYP